MKRAVLVLGYNNTRINDVRKIQNKATEYLNAITVLCKKNPTKEDEKAVDYVIDVGLEASQQNVDTVIKSINDASLKVVALLPFSDPGTQLGAALSKKLNLRGPDLDQVEAALDKYIFRKFEKITSGSPTQYRKIRSEKVNSFEELEKICNELNGHAFLKPAKEGNSRGCINMLLEKDIHKAWDQVRQYAEDGVVVEELIPNGQEYSWDHVSGFSWVTEKKTTNNQYRSEIQQIVPAPLALDKAKIIHETGEFMSKVSGSCNSACHNEVFSTDHFKSIFAVEPNLRPAGMRIWDLANLAFEDFDPWKEWLLWASGDKSFAPRQLNQNYFAGIRMIYAPSSGVLKNINSVCISDYSNDKIEIMEIVWTKKIGDKLIDTVRDNSEFIGYIIARSKNYSDLDLALQAICDKLKNEVEVSCQLEL